MSGKEQYKRFKSRMTDPMCRQKLLPTDLEFITHWEEYLRARDEIFIHTDIDIVPWNVVELRDRRKARVNMIHYLLDSTPYEHVERPALELPERPSSNGRRCMDHAFPREVPDYASALKASSEQKKYADPEDEETLQGRTSSI